MAEETDIPFGKTGISYYENMIDSVSNLSDSSGSRFCLRFSNVLVIQLRPTHPWVLRHPASAWQNRYSKNRAKFEEEIRKYKSNPRNIDLGEGGSRLPESQERLDNNGVGEGGMPLESPITAGRMRLREAADGMSLIIYLLTRH